MSNPYEPPSEEPRGFRTWLHRAASKPLWIFERPAGSTTPQSLWLGLAPHLLLVLFIRHWPMDAPGRWNLLVEVAWCLVLFGISRLRRWAMLVFTLVIFVRFLLLLLVGSIQSPGEVAEDPTHLRL